MDDSRPTKPKRRWYQFSLRALLVFVAMCAIACSWFAVEMHQAAKRRAAIAEIIKLDGAVLYYDTADPENRGRKPGTSLIFTGNDSPP